MDIKELNNNMATWYNIVNIIALIALIVCYVWRWETYTYTDAAFVPCIMVLIVNTAMFFYRYYDKL